MASRDIVGAVEWVESLAPEGDKIPALVEKGKNAFAGPEVSGKRLGVIGLGAIGSRVANAALKLDMEVSGYDPYLSVDSAWNLSSKVEHVTDLNVLFRTCDYLTMHIHSTPETFHYLNAETFAKMKPGMRILNFARGELVDDDALLAAIESGQVARYVTDFPNAKLVGKKNVVCFPHLGATTPEAEEKCAISARDARLSRATSATASERRLDRPERAACASSTATGPACSTGFEIIAAGTSTLSTCSTRREARSPIRSSIRPSIWTKRRRRRDARHPRRNARAAAGIKIKRTPAFVIRRQAFFTQF